MARMRVVKNRSPRELILKKAAILFRKKGYAASSMRELALSLGIEAPSLYNHIGSKGDILKEICFDIAEKFNGNIGEVENAGLSAPQSLEAVIRSHIDLMINAFDEVFVANHEWKQLTDPAHTAYFQMRRDYENRVAHIIDEGMKKGELKQMNPVAVMLTILAALRGIESWHRHRKNISQKELEDTMVSHLLKGIIK